MVAIAVVLLVLIVVGVYFGRRKYIARKEFRDHVKAQEATNKALNGSNMNMQAGGNDQFGYNGADGMNGVMMMNGGGGGGGMHPMERTSSFVNQSPIMSHGYGMQPDPYHMDINTAGSYHDGMGSIDGNRQRGVTSQFEPEW